jgi:hypothetical protein
MPIDGFDAEVFDEIEVEALSDYLEGRMSDNDELKLEERLEMDRGFRARLQPLLKACSKSEMLPVEREMAIRLARRGIMLAPIIPLPRWRPKRRRQGRNIGRSREHAT